MAFLTSLSTAWRRPPDGTSPGAPPAGLTGKVTAWQMHSRVRGTFPVDEGPHLSVLCPEMGGQWPWMNRTTELRTTPFLPKIVAPPTWLSGELVLNRWPCDQHISLSPSPDVTPAALQDVLFPFS